MRTSAQGLEAIKTHEGLRLAAYRDSVGILTIGYGHTRDVLDGQVITEDQATFFLQHDVVECENCIERNVRVQLTQGQFDALVSFVFNLGCGRLKRSTLLKKLNAGDYSGAASEFGKWTLAGGKRLQGLIARREAEKEMFLT